MGAGASTAPNNPPAQNKHQRHQLEAERASLTRGVERFVINVYASFPRSESMRIILSSDLARDAFYLFLKTEHAEECFNLYLDVSKLRQKMPNPYNLSKEINRIVGQYIRTETDSQVMISFALQESCIASLSADPYAEGYTEKMFQLCGELQEEAVMLMARDQFNRFLLSKNYKVWRAAESSHAMATTAADANRVQVATAQGRSPQAKTDKAKSRRATDLSVRAFSNIDAAEIGKLLGSENWLAALLAAVEGLPVSFCLATARKERRGFPLMYVNKYFEKMTGLSRSDVLGKNCRFLQCEKTDKNIVSTVSEALRNGKPITTVLVNKNVKGIEFTNLISLKPIFDDKGTYCYVICIQVDVTSEDGEYSGKMKLAQDLMDMLPSVMFTDDEDVPVKTGLFARKLSNA